MCCSHLQSNHHHETALHFVSERQASSDGPRDGSDMDGFGDNRFLIIFHRDATKTRTYCSRTTWVYSLPTTTTIIIIIILTYIITSGGGIITK
jgi:hypothetical protein